MDYIKKGKELFDKDLEEKKHLIDNLLPYGLTLLVGKPKTGKSTLLYNICFNITEGDKICDYFPTETQEVLYITYEDNERKIKRLANNLSNGNLDNFYYSLQFPRQENGGIEELEDVIKQNPNLKLICIDTLIKFSPTQKSSYGGSYSRLEKLHSISHQYEVAIVLTHHTRKSILNYNINDDEFEEILGSQGLRGLVDTTIFMSNDYIKIEGREIEEVKYSLKQDNLRFTLEDYQKDLGKEDKKYIDFLWEIGRPATLKEIYENFPDKKESTIRNRLRILLEDGRLAKPSRGEYEIGAYWDRFY